MMTRSAWRPDRLLIERSEWDTPVARRARAALPGVPVAAIDDVRALRLAALEHGAAGDSFAAGKRQLLLHRERGRFLAACQAGTPGLVCCNYLTLTLVSNCPFDCSYCFLQEYLSANPILQAVTNVEGALGEMAAVLDAHPTRTFRIGTGELADSLALEPLLGHAARLVEFAAVRPNVLMELKTKSACVDDLLPLDSRGRTVVSWSLSPPSIADREETGAASFGERLAAAARCQSAGYRVGFHFDPLHDYEGCEDEYRGVIEALAATVDVARLAWLSLGSLRVTSRLSGIVRERHPRSRVLLGEHVRGADGKWRVFQGRRVALYRRLERWLREAAPEVPLYMCMESPAVWERVFGAPPPEAPALAQRLTG
jgi:spore photoproduct lyase